MGDINLFDDPLNQGYVKRFKRKSFLEQNTSFDAIVIGSGPGGLATASLLAQWGQRVCVLEQHDRIGGGTHEFSSHGFTFDTGFHYIGEMTDPRSPLRRMFNFVAGNDGPKIQFFPINECPVKPGLTDQVYVVDESKTYQIPAGAARLQEELTAQFPDHAGAIKGYFRDCKRASESLAPRLVSQSLAGSSNWLYDWLSRVLLRPFLQWAGETYEHRLTHKIGIGSGSKLTTLLGYLWGCHGAKPSDCAFAVHALIQEHFAGGASYCRPALLSRSMAATIHRHQGRVFVNAPAQRILLNNDGSVRGVRVRGVDLTAPIVVSGVGVHQTFETLLSPNNDDDDDDDDDDNGNRAVFNQFWDIPGPRHQQPSSSTDSDLCPLLHTRGSGAMKLTHGHVCLFVGLRGTSNELKLPRANTWVLPSLHGRLYNNLVDEYRASDKGGVFTDGGNVFPYLGIGFPSAKDPTYQQRHPGKSCCIIILECPARWWGGHGALDRVPGRRGPQHDSLKKKFETTLLSHLFKQFPQLEDCVEHVELGTPLDNRRWLGKPAGDSYGLEPTPSFFKSTQSKLTPTVRSCPGLYITGQDVNLDGFAGALTGGYSCAGAIIGPIRFWLYILFNVIGLGSLIWPPSK